MLNYSKYEIIFDEPRLRMTVAGRLLIRIIAYIAYFFFGVGAFISLLSDFSVLRYFGILLLLILIDRVIHRREADQPFNERPGGNRLNLKIYLSPRAYAIIEKAFDRGGLKKTDFFLEILLQLISLPEIKDGLRRLDIKPEEFKQKTETILNEAEKNNFSKPDRLKQIEDLVKEAFQSAIAGSGRFIEPKDIFSALSKIKDASVSRIFSMFSIEAGDLERALIFTFAKKKILGWRNLPKTLGGFILGPPRIRHRIMNRAWTSRPTPVLDRFSTDLTDLARQEQVGFLIGHEQEYQRMIDALSRPINPNALMVGEPGIGKESVIKHLAFTLTKDEVPQALFDKRLVALQIGDLVAGAPPEELQSRLQKIAEEISLAENIILYIPEIHNLVKTSGTAYLSAADALMPIIKNNIFPVIGTSYPREFKTFIEPRSDFIGLFEIIQVSEISEEDAERLLVYDSLLFERQSKILISFGAIKQAVKLAKKYFHRKFLPSSAEELLKDALALASRRGEKTLGPDLVIAAAETKINVPIHKAGQTETEILLNLENLIHQRLVDQEEAVKAVSRALREYRSGLARPGGPIANFLFVGPTGVGKTELAKILTRIQFGGEELMTRFDMSEFQDKQSFYRFIGSPDGQISGLLTEAITQKPYSLILLDEFEKAHPDILNLFLQVFDDGRLTDNWGRTIDFQNTIIIATSNAHSDIIKRSLDAGESMMSIAEYLKKSLIDVFRPELLNRFSAVIVFKELNPEEVRLIAKIQLKDLADLVENQGIYLEFDEAAVQNIARLGYDPAFGARPLRRAIEEHLRAPLAEKILRQEIIKGNKILLTWRDDKFQFVQAAETR